MANRILRNIPSVNELLEMPLLKSLVDKVSHNVVVSEVRAFLDDLRHQVKSRAEEISIPSPSEIAERVAQWISQEEQPRLRPVVNATGIVLHTGLGRAPLAKSALEAVVALAGSYASLELDLDSGERGQRHTVVERLLRELTSAEAAFVVNNCAAATLLTLAALAEGREVLVSRGELIEIGGNYRLPDVMCLSGARLREVGTTNRTRCEDYASACCDQTAALLKVHSSNYRIVGYTQSASLEELVELGQKVQVPVIHDLGSGALVDLRRFGIADEPGVRESIEAGADLVLFSGDKLLGGPQCGIILGRRALVHRLIEHPLARAVRVDKLTLAALHATLQIYRRAEQIDESLPIMTLLSTSLENLRHRAERLAPLLAASPQVANAEVCQSTAQLGGGSTPAQGIPSICIRVQAAGSRPQELARSLRQATIPVWTRVHRALVHIDLRTVFADQDIWIVQAFQSHGPSHERAPDEGASSQASNL